MTAVFAYVESSAGVKLYKDETESEALRTALLEWTGFIVSSDLLHIEATRVGRRPDVMREQEAAAVLEAVTFIPISEEIRDVAGIVGARELKSLDAIHLATAFSLAMDDRLGVLFAYDNGVINSARLEGLPVVTPVSGPLTGTDPS